MGFDRKAFGARLRDARIARGLTQEQVGEVMGWRQSRVSEHETGRYLMTLDTLTEYVEKLGLDPAILFPQWVGTADHMIAKVEHLV